jgi:hypothetical protein
MPKTFIIVNYIIRSSFIVLGLILGFAPIAFLEQTDSMFRTTFSVVMVLFGVYRLVAFRTQLMQYELEQKKRERDENR